VFYLWFYQETIGQQDIYFKIIGLWCVPRAQVMMHDTYFSKRRTICDYSSLFTRETGRLIDMLLVSMSTTHYTSVSSCPLLWYIRHYHLLGLCAAAEISPGTGQCTKRYLLRPTSNVRSKLTHTKFMINSHNELYYFIPIANHCDFIEYTQTAFCPCMIHAYHYLLLFYCEYNQIGKMKWTRANAVKIN
jgi:hypothetical protein